MFYITGDKQNKDGKFYIRDSDSGKGFYLEEDELELLVSIAPVLGAHLDNGKVVIDKLCSSASMLLNLKKSDMLSVWLDEYKAWFTVKYQGYSDGHFHFKLGCGKLSFSAEDIASKGIKVSLTMVDPVICASIEFA